MMLRSFAAALLAAPLLVCAQDAAKEGAKPAAKPAAKASAKAGAQTPVAHVNGVAVPQYRNMHELMGFSEVWDFEKKWAS